MRVVFKGSLMNKGYDTIIIGGGVVGCLDVNMFDQDRPPIHRTKPADEKYWIADGAT